MYSLEGVVQVLQDERRPWLQSRATMLGISGTSNRSAGRAGRTSKSSTMLPCLTSIIKHLTKFGRVRWEDLVDKAEER